MLPRNIIKIIRSNFNIAIEEEKLNYKTQSLLKTEPLKIHNMKSYNLDTEFTFGRYEGKTVRQILDLQISYLNWCAIHLDHFYISEEVIEEIKTFKPNFAFTEEEQLSLDCKYNNWENEQVERRPSYDREDRYTERDNFDALTDGQYGDYDDWRDSGGDMDRLMDGMGF